MIIHRNVRLLAIFNFLHDLDFLAPVAIIYFQQVTGSFALGMSVFSAVMLSSALFEVPTGIFSDMIGRKKTVVCGSLASLAATLSIAIVRSYAGLLIGAILFGVARAFFSGNNDALLYDSLADNKLEHRYHSYLGMVNAFFEVGGTISALFGSIFAFWSFHFLLWITVVPKILMVVVSLVFVEPTPHRRVNSNIFIHLGESIVQFRKNTKLQLLTIVSALRFAIGESSYTFRSAFVATLWPLWLVGVAPMLSNIGAGLGSYFSGRVINRFTAKKILVFEIIGNRIINFIALLFPTFVSPILMSFTSLAYGSSNIALSSLSQKEFTAAQRATMGSLGSLLNKLLFSVCAVGLGFIADFLGPVHTLLIAHGTLLIALLFYRQIFSGRTPK